MNGLSEIQIKSILNRHGYSINGVYSKDQIPLVLKPGWIVINLEDYKTIIVQRAVGLLSHVLCLIQKNPSRFISIVLYPCSHHSRKRMI